MNISRIAAILCVFAAPFAVSAQITCPADPLQKLNGQNWVFEMHSSNYAFGGSAAIGRFSASVVNGQGVLSITETVNDGLNISRLATVSGRYQVYADCSGGELLFMLNGYAAQLEFVFINNTEMYLVTDYLASRSGSAVPLTGTAKLAATPACPAGVNPLATLLNSSWVFRTLQSQWQGAGSGSVGFFNANIVNGQGFLTAVETVNNNGIASRLAPESGRYQIYADCSGGEIMLMNRKDPVQFEFVFTSNNLDEMYMINDSIGSSLTILVGQAKKRSFTGPCPADPLQFLSGSTWSFQMRGSQLNGPGNSAAAIGRFSASVVNGRGVLNVSETLRDGLSLTRLAQGGGIYQVYSDCSGGELLFNVNRAAVQLEFVIADNNEIYFVSDSSGFSEPHAVVVGNAYRNAPAACPTGVSPLQVLDKTSWAFRTFLPYHASGAAGFTDSNGSASVGIFRPITINGSGFLTAVETVNNGGQVSRLAQETGRVIAYADCSGGEILLMNRSFPVQLEFVYTNGNFNDMFLLSDTNSNVGFGLLQGRARKQ